VRFPLRRAETALTLTTELIPLNAEAGLRRTMPLDVSRHKQRHREGSKIAPKHARAFCDARSRETMRKQSMRRLGRRIASPSAFLGSTSGVFAAT
jgi:hypothetical protein